MGMEDSSGVNEDIDQELAPLGSSDSELETDDGSWQEPLEIRNLQGNKSTATGQSPSPFKETEDVLSVRQLRILLFALCSGIQKAAKDMDTEPKLIRTWLRDKEKRLDCQGLGSSSEEAVEHLVEWVLVQREQQYPIGEEGFFQKASEIRSQTNQSSSFRISYDWAVTFMLQHKLGLHKLGIPGHQLPRKMKENCKDFTQFVHRQIKTHNVPLSAFGAMDELSIFVDFDRLVHSTGTSRDSAFRLEGTGKPWMNIYLSVLANGTVLPTIMYFKGTPLESISKGLSDIIKLEAKVEGFSEKEELDMWNSNVWQQYLNSQNGNKVMLVIDSHHSHMTEDFLSVLSRTQTVPMVIPSGCSSRRQPLEMCVLPVLKKFLLCRWSCFATQNRTGEIKPIDLAQLLVSWLEEALACCSVRPQMIQHSFCYSRLITEHESCKRDSDAQLKHLNALTEAMLGPTAIDSESHFEEESITKHVTGILEKEDDLDNDTSSVAQTVKEIPNKNDSKTEMEKTKTEQQAQKTINEGLVSSKTAESSSPPLPENSQSQTIIHVNEKEEHTELCQDIDSSQKDAGFHF